MPAADILIVDDETDIRSLIQGILEDEGYRCRQAANAAQARDQLDQRIPDLMIQDIWLQNSDQDGMQILADVKVREPDLPVIMISGHGTIEMAVSAIRQGAYDFIEKPFKTDRLLLMVERALEAAALRRENRALKEKVELGSELIGHAAPLTQLRSLLERIAPSNSRVLFSGEPGTGKEVAARALHRLSSRANGPFVVLTCAVLHPERLEEELFGNEEEPGVPSRIGLLEQASGGTLLLDEVADMPLETQAKILRALQEQRFARIGGKVPVEVDVRVLASTNRDLEALIAEGKFRQDLFYRLNVVPVHMPPLRERRADIPDLVAHFMTLYSKETGRPGKPFSAAALAALEAHDWPGNIRQLRNVVEWLMILDAGDGEKEILPEHLPPEFGGSLSRSGAGTTQHLPAEMISLPLKEARDAFERDYLQAQLARFNGNISRTAQFVGMERTALHRKLKVLNVLGDEKEDSLVRTA